MTNHVCLECGYPVQYCLKHKSYHHKTTYGDSRDRFNEECQANEVFEVKR